MRSLVLYGIVGGEVATKPGWYQVLPSHCEGIVVGTSIRRTVLSAGQRVSIVQAFSGGRAEYGFIEASYAYDSLYNAETARDSAIASAPAACAMYELLRRADATRRRYIPATVTAVGASSLTVDDRFTGASRVVSVVSGLTAAEFWVGDGVIIDDAKGAGAVCFGWWQVDNSVSLYVVAGSDRTTIYRIPRKGPVTSRAITGAGPYEVMTPSVVADVFPADIPYVYLGWYGNQPWSIARLNIASGFIETRWIDSTSGFGNAATGSPDSFAVHKSANASGSPDGATSMWVTSLYQQPAGVWNFSLFKRPATGAETYVVLSSGADAQSPRVAISSGEATVYVSGIRRVAGGSITEWEYCYWAVSKATMTVASSSFHPVTFASNARTAAAYKTSAHGWHLGASSQRLSSLAGAGVETAFSPAMPTGLQGGAVDGAYFYAITASAADPAGTIKIRRWPADGNPGASEIYCSGESIPAGLATLLAASPYYVAMAVRR